MPGVGGLRPASRAPTRHALATAGTRLRPAHRAARSSSAGQPRYAEASGHGCGAGPRYGGVCRDTTTSTSRGSGGAGVRSTPAAVGCIDSRVGAGGCVCCTEDECSDP